MKHTWAIKSYHSEDCQTEILQASGMHYWEAVQMLTVFRADWLRMTNLQVRATRGRVEAKGATFFMSVWMEKEWN